MNESDAKSLILATLAEIAPGSDTATLKGEDDLREALDLDSMDFLNFLVALHTKSGHEIPDRDAPRLYTLDGAVKYLSGKA